jgi:hypothetical protein
MRLRRWQVAALLLLSAMSASAQDFRKVTWGMSVDDVIAAESGLEFSELDGTSKSMLSSHVEVMGRTGILTYTFENQKLVIAQYKFDDEDDMGTCKDIRSVLTRKYGAAADSGDTSARWNLPRTFISLSFKDNLCRVDYADQGWVSEVREKRRAEYDSLF